MKVINFKNEELLIDKNTDEPIIIVYDLEEEQQKTLRIKVSSKIKASLVEVFTGNSIKTDLKREFIVDKDAKLEYLKFQDISKESSLEINYNLHLEESSSLQITNLELGLGDSTNYFETNLHEEHAKLEINGLVKLYESANSSSIFVTKHIAQNCFSNIKYKHSLSDSSKAIFEAKSIVEEKANFSKVLQSSDTLLLSEDAVIFARPHLEINIDELEASHGATTGTLDREQLLYLQARGIPEQKAKEMLLKAFENEIYDNIQDSKIKEFITSYKRREYV